MQRHYKIMQIMRTKILSMRELVEGAQGIMYIHNTIVYRIQDLKRVSVLSPSMSCYANVTL